MKTVVAQIGAREHYAVARALYDLGLLSALVTDWYAFHGPGNNRKVAPGNEGDWRAISGKRKFLQRLAGSAFGLCGGRGKAALAARCEAIPDDLVFAFPLRSLLWKWRVRRLAALGRSHEAYLQTDRVFSSAMTRLVLPPHEVFFGYSYASLEMLEAEKKRGVLTVLDQIDPGAEEFRLVAEEMSRFPDLAGPPPEFPTAYYERNRREWELADVILVNSEWTREALISAGVNPGKIEILPLAFEISALKAEMSKCRNTATPLHVLFLGQVNVRKGIHYLMEAARRLEGEPVHFDVVGPVAITEAAVKSAPANMTFHGPVTRDRAAEWYRQSDVFVLPTLSDGFALTQLEAMAYGLPVIVTPNCGRVVEAGKTGFFVPARDSLALAEAILRFVRNRELAREMAPACCEAVNAYSVAAHGQRLVEVFNQYKATNSQLEPVRVQSHE